MHTLFCCSHPKIGIFHPLLVFTDGAHFAHTHHLSGHSALPHFMSQHSPHFYKLLFSLSILFYLLFVSLTRVCLIFPPLPVPRATPIAARGSFLQCRSIPAGFLSLVLISPSYATTQSGHSALLCYAAAAATLCRVHSWSAAPAVLLLLLTLMLQLAPSSRCFTALPGSKVEP